jgi:hypothetical protein
MSNEPFALSPVTPSSPPPSESEYEAICATVMESARGRWFLSEYARRNRHADTRLVVDAIGRLEAAIRGDPGQPVDELRSALSDIAEAIARAKADIAAIKSSDEHEARIIETSEELDSIVDATEHATSTILAAAEHVQEIAWTMREQDINARYCDELDAEATAIYTACSFQDLTGQRTHKVIQVMRYIEGRINALVDVWADLAKTAPAKAKPPAVPNGHDFGEVDAQARSERAPDDDVNANDLLADERKAPLPLEGDNPAAYLELEPLIPSHGRDPDDADDAPHAVFLGTGAAVMAADFGSTEIRADTIAHTPASETAPAELGPIDLAARIGPPTAPVAEIGGREQVPTVSMLEAGGAQAIVPSQIETENGDEVPTVSMLEAAMQRLATEPDVGRPPRVILAAVAAQAEELPVAVPMKAEATREETVSAIDEEAAALLHGSESSPDSERSETILVLPATAARDPDGMPPLGVSRVAFDPGAAQTSKTDNLAAPGDADAGDTVTKPEDAGVELRIAAPITAESAPAAAEREPTGATPPPIQLKPDVPTAATGPAREAESIRGRADTSENDLTDLLFDPERKPSTPVAWPNPLPVVQFENGSSALAAPKGSAQVVAKPGVFASVSSQSVDRGGPNAAPTAAAPKGIRTEGLAAAAASPAPRGPTQQSPQRPMPRPAANDTLAAILALSEEEKIALFS